MALTALHCTPFDYLSPGIKKKKNIKEEEEEEAVLSVLLSNIKMTSTAPEESCKIFLKKLGKLYSHHNSL